MSERLSREEQPGYTLNGMLNALNDCGYRLDMLPSPLNRERKKWQGSVRPEIQLASIAPICSVAEVAYTDSQGYHLRDVANNYRNSAIIKEGPDIFYTIPGSEASDLLPYLVGARLMFEGRIKKAEIVSDITGPTQGVPVGYDIELLPNAVAIHAVEHPLTDGELSESNKEVISGYIDGNVFSVDQLSRSRESVFHFGKVDLATSNGLVSIGLSHGTSSPSVSEQVRMAVNTMEGKTQSYHFYTLPDLN